MDFNLGEQSYPPQFWDRKVTVEEMALMTGSQPIYRVDFGKTTIWVAVQPLKAGIRPVTPFKV
jgi:hypothetical protein